MTDSPTLDERVEVMARAFHATLRPVPARWGGANLNSYDALLPREVSELKKGISAALTALESAGYVVSRG